MAAVENGIVQEMEAVKTEVDVDVDESTIKQEPRGRSVTPVVNSVENIEAESLMESSEYLNGDLLQAVQNGLMTPESSALIESELALATSSLGAILDPAELAAIKEDIMRGVAKLQEEMEIETVEAEKPVMKCDVCGKIYKSASFFRKHLETHKEGRKFYMNETTKRYDCEIEDCDESFTTLDRMQRHMGQTHGYKSEACDQCDSRFATKGDLRKHLRITHKTERDIKCQHCDKGFKCERNKNDHEKRVHMKTKAKHPCTLCEKVYMNSDGLKDHIRVAHTGEKPFSCSFCTMTFARRYCWRTHEMKHTDTWPYPCDQCPAKCRSSSDLTKHKQVHRKHTLPKNFKCTKCPKKFEFKQNLRKHMIRHDQTTRDFICKICDSGFFNIRSLREHRINKHTIRERKYKCETCGKGFMDKENLTVHMKWHSGVREFQCHLCPKNYVVSKDLKEHLEVHESNDTGIKNHECDICLKRFANRTQMLSHKLRHDAPRKHKCEICGKGFTTTGYLKIHVARHNNIRPYSCELCGQKFLQKSDVRIHERIHTGEKPYKCSYCDRRFSQNSQKHQHEGRIHRKDKPFECDVCSRRFFCRYSLNSHRLKAHTDFKLKCPKCPRIFSKNRSLQLHLQAHTRTHNATRILKTIQCQICDKWVKSQHGLMMHTRTTHKPKMEDESETESDYESETESKSVSLKEEDSGPETAEGAEQYTKLEPVESEFGDCDSRKSSPTNRLGLNFIAEVKEAELDDMKDENEITSVNEVVDNNDEVKEGELDTDMKDELTSDDIDEDEVKDELASQNDDDEVKDEITNDDGEDDDNDEMKDEITSQSEDVDDERDGDDNKPSSVTSEQSYLFQKQTFKDRDIECEFCQRRFGHLANLNRHISCIHPERYTKSVTPTSSKNENTSKKNSKSKKTKKGQKR